MKRHLTALSGLTLALTAAFAGPAIAGSGSTAAAEFSAGDCGSYEVQAGDTLSAIALREVPGGSSAQAIFHANAETLSSPDVIEPGMVLQLPCAGDAPAGVAPVWTAQAGDYLVPTLSEWGARAGHDVIVEQNSDWRFGVDYRGEGSFREALDEVIAGFSTAAVPPVVTFYTNNVMTIGVR